MKCKELIKLLSNHGWYTLRQSGSHVIMQHPSLKGNIVIPNHGSAEVKEGLMHAILKKAGIKTTGK